MSPVWHTKVEGLLAPMEAYEEDHDIEKVRTAVVECIKRDLRVESGDDPDLDELLDVLCSVDTEESFNEAWGEMYDWADRERVWLDTMP